MSKPIIFYNLRTIRRAGVLLICVVVALIIVCAGIIGSDGHDHHRDCRRNVWKARIYVANFLNHRAAGGPAVAFPRCDTSRDAIVSMMNFVYGGGRVTDDDASLPFCGPTQNHPWIYFASGMPIEFARAVEAPVFICSPDIGSGGFVLDAGGGIQYYDREALKNYISNVVEKCESARFELDERVLSAIPD